MCIRDRVRVYLSENAAQVNEQGYAGVQVNNPLNDTFIREVSQVSGVKGKSVDSEYHY